MTRKRVQFPRAPATRYKVRQTGVRVHLQRDLLRQAVDLRLPARGAAKSRESVPALFLAYFRAVINFCRYGPSTHRTATSLAAPFVDTTIGKSLGPPESSISNLASLQLQAERAPEGKAWNSSGARGSESPTPQRAPLNLPLSN